MDQQAWVVSGADRGARLDRWLANQLPGQSRSAVQRWIKEGLVMVDGKIGRANLRLDGDEQVVLHAPPDDLPPTPLAGLEAEAIPLSILYEDADLIAIDKPAGLVVHPAPGHGRGTLVNAILHYCPDLPGIAGELRPGIVHRLDKDTSGVIVVAKHEAALRYLQAQFKQRQVEKHYLALVEGNVKQSPGRISAPLGRDPHHRQRQAVLSESAVLGGSRARQAITEYTVRARYVVPLHNDLGRGTFSLVDAHPITGRTHQIRVHFAWIGHPIVGDPLYGLRTPRLAVPRLFLHAARLSLRRPSDDSLLDLNAPLPDDLRAVVDRLAALSPG